MISVSQYVNPMSKVVWNSVKLPRKDKGKGWSVATARTTVFLCQWLWENNYLFACEVKMKGGELRADIFAPELYGSQVIEIMDSEGKESLERKKLAYKKLGLTCVGVPADFKEAIIILKAENNIGSVK